MIRRSTWILVAVFMLLAGFTWLFQRSQSKKTADTATSTPSPTPEMLYNLAGAQINAISISSSAGEKLDLYRDPTSTNWAIKDVPMGQADTNQIDAVSKQLAVLQVQETFTQSLTMDSVDLISPAYTITLTTTDGTNLTIFIGSENAIGNGYYVRVDSEQAVLVSNTVIDEVINLLKNPPLLPTATPGLTQTGTIVPSNPGAQTTATP